MLSPGPRVSVNIENHRRTLIAELEWLPRPDGLERAVVFQPGFNDVSDGPDSHGVHGMEIWWYLRGPKGAAFFVLYTGLIPGEVWPGHGLPPAGGPAYRFPPSGDLGYHAHIPQYDEQLPSLREDCTVLGGRCFCDVSGLAGSDLAGRFVAEGEPVVWAALEARYESLDGLCSGCGGDGKCCCGDLL